MFHKERKKFNDQTGNLVTIFKPYSSLAEEYKAIRSNIQFSAIGSTFSSMIVTSAGPGEGKSTVAANTAAAFAAQGKKVLLVDADLRSPSLHTFFNTSNREGLTTLLMDKQVKLKETLQPTYQRNLSLLPTGPLPSNPSELLSSTVMDDCMLRMEDQFDLVIFDMPPIVTVTDAQIMAGKADGTLFVVRNKVTDTAQMMKAKQLLEHARANVIGVVFNGKEKLKSDSIGYGNYFNES